MKGSTIWFDRLLFNEDVISRAAHRYTNFFHVDFCTNAHEVGVVLTVREGVERPADLEARFRDDALDERLRESVRQETQSIHTELIRAALREAHPRVAEAER
ncbi:hypothetical protein ACYX7E_04380 [Luteimonas sp. RIT-PG2_3]